MSVVEHPRDWTEQEKLEWVDTNFALGICSNNTIDNWIPEYTINYKKKCCANCKFFEHLKSRDEDGLCLKNVANDLSGQYILDSDTFYCSYHKFKD